MIVSPNNALRTAIREVISVASGMSWRAFLEALAERGFAHVRMQEVKAELNAAIAELEGEVE